MTEPMTLCCLLWAHSGREQQLIAYEDVVLALLPEHRGNVVKRAIGSGADGHPVEVQFLRFADQGALDGFMRDPRRTALAAQRDEAIARTEVFAVALAE